MNSRTRDSIIPNGVTWWVTVLLYFPGDCFPCRKVFYREQNGSILFPFIGFSRLISVDKPSLLPSLSRTQLRINSHVRSGDSVKSAAEAAQAQAGCWTVGDGDLSEMKEKAEKGD